MEPAIQINPGATKWDIRQKVWDYIEENNLANFPRPVHNRIPNFKGAIQACNRLTDLQEFKSSKTVKVNPDRPQQQARFLTLEAGKTLLVPTPRLRTGLFNNITPPEGASKEQLRICSSSQGVKDFSVPVGLDSKVKVDLVVVGSVAVSEKGLRIGKGEGFADLEYGMMVSMGAVNESTVVVTIVHDCQVMDLPEELIESHDLTVDYILTPTRVIETKCQTPKPQGIIWTKLDPEKLEKIPVLKKLRELEEEGGKDVTLGVAPEGTEPGLHTGQTKRPPRRRPRRNIQQDDEGESKQEKIGDSDQKPRQRPPRVRKEGRGDGGGENDREFNKRGRGGRRGDNMREKDQEEGASEVPTQRRLPLSVTTVYLGGIPAGLRVSELKTALREREAIPLRLTWQGAQHRAFLDYSDPQAAEVALESLQDLSLNGHSLQAELAKSQRGGKRAGQSNRRERPPTAPENTTDPPEAENDTNEKAEQE
ncbi:methenyltetrahydrofolate synthase domain-containing protein isoform X2 [Gymnodraco acuticeps]|uniref:Methenyltetrahydrofolate synthase domain-containing protein n=2 Tax=Notothenioidei TaxID=8205 RepID=A0A6P8T6R5_GYMAC|nr:methenyltetrahydrofolate synthase domain-containing protein isoform X2 [Trematomus bernacchii]XP_034052875.1 methenyltetrahydrofolate synthase domain-containing protein isoform X2 [Gymnodraco acuticeps]KAK1891056.1 Methenyltetrahydrofolate synthase domain containing protein [Dissostichus eleginoides]